MDIYSLQDIQQLSRVFFEVPPIVRPDGHGWIYFLFKNNEVVYVGQTIKNSPLSRIGDHFNGKDFDSLAFIAVPVEDLSEYELRYIKHFNPVFNKTGRVTNAMPCITFAQQVIIQEESDSVLNCTEAVALWSSRLTRQGIVVTSMMRTIYPYHAKKIMTNVSTKKTTLSHKYLKSEVIGLEMDVYRSVINTIKTSQHD